MSPTSSRPSSSDGIDRPFLEGSYHDIHHEEKPQLMVDFPINKAMAPWRVLTFAIIGALVASLIWTMALGTLAVPASSCAHLPTALEMDTKDGHRHDHSNHPEDWRGPTDPDGYPFPLSAVGNPLVNLSVPYTQPAIKPGEVPETNGPGCGGALDVAKARGCKFDWTVNSWVPPPCYSEELTQAFVEAREWFVYEDEERTKRVPIESVVTGVHENLWIDWGYHVLHCEFAFKKVALAARTPSMAYVGQAINEYHTDHCIKEVLANRTYEPLDVQDTYLHRGWASCYRKA